MPPDTQARLFASVCRALWGEVSDKLRCVQFHADSAQIRLLFVFEGPPEEPDVDSVGAIGAEVAADFPGCTVTEETLATDPADQVARRDGWHLAYARKEPALVR
jgi:hypothetical protein